MNTNSKYNILVDSLQSTDNEYIKAVVDEYLQSSNVDMSSDPMKPQCFNCFHKRLYLADCGAVVVRGNAASILACVHFNLIIDIPSVLTRVAARHLPLFNVKSYCLLNVCAFVSSVTFVVRLGLCSIVSFPFFSNLDYRMTCDETTALPHISLHLSWTSSVLSYCWTHTKVTTQALLAFARVARWLQAKKARSTLKKGK